MGDASSPPPSSTRNDALGDHNRSSGTTIPIRIITHNVRFATDAPEKHERLWTDRFPHLSSHFKYHTRPHFSPQSTLVCLQEVLHEQLLDLHHSTFNTSATGIDGNDWTYVGVGRNDGNTKGEYSPIFFRQSAWKSVHFETVWLNETGEVGKKGWDASSIRILTCAVLESVLLGSGGEETFSPPAATGGAFSTRRTILALNTHLDDQGEEARREGTKLILQVASRLRSKYSPDFTFLSGDLNSSPSGDAYKILNTPGSGFVDTRRLIADDDKNRQGKIYAYGNELTFTGFQGDSGAGGKQRIDFIHLGIPGGSEDRVDLEQAKQMLQGYGVLPNRFDDKVWLSDHRAVVVDLLVPLGGH